MGESGGVRTMIWSYDQTNSSQPNNHQVQASEEVAAQLLLSLGQTSENTLHHHRMNSNRQASASPNTPTTTQSQNTPLVNNSPARQMVNPAPTTTLNMERLWAGDLSQLPAGQQLHALNLSREQHAMQGAAVGNAAASWLQQYKDVSTVISSQIWIICK